MTKGIVTRNGDVWQAAREVSCVDVARRCGLELKRRGRRWRTVCPFHAGAENGTSFMVDEGGFRCWACGEHGDGITLYAGLQNITPLDAARALAGNRSCSVPSEEGMRRELARRAFRAWEQRRFLFLVKVCGVIEARLAVDGLDVEEPWLSGVHLLPQLKHEVLTLAGGSEEEKLELWRRENGR